MEPHTILEAPLRQPEEEPLPNALHAASALALARQFLPWLLVVCAAIPFLFSLRSGFVYDDDVQIVHNNAIHTWHGALAYVFPAVISRQAPAPINGNYYRPLFFLWLRLNYGLFGLNATGWHVASLLLHLGVTLLVFFLLRRHFPDSERSSPGVWLAAAGALLFAIHPAHVESVVWVSGATDTLAALGMLSGLLLWMRSDESHRAGFLTLSLGCYAAALLSKETAIVLPALIFVYSLLGIAKSPSSARSSGGLWPAIRETLPFLAVSALYFAVRLRVLHGFRSGAPWISSREALLTAPRVGVFYVRHLLWPINLSLFYDLQPVHRMASAGFLLPLLLLSLVGMSAWFCWRRSGPLQEASEEPRRDAIIPAAFAWLILPLVPVLDIALFQREDFAHDRYLYLPVIGLAMLCVALLQLLRPASWSASPINRRAFVVVVTLLFTLLAASTAAQAQFWRDDLALYSHALEQSKNTGARNNLASLYAKAGRIDEADALLTPLIQEEPDSWLVNYNFGYVNYQQRHFALAERYLNRAITLDPSDSGQYTYLGLTFLREGRVNDAAAQLHLALSRDPAAEGCHLALGFILEQMGDLVGARAEFLQELKNHPSLVAANQLAKVQGAIADKATASHEPSASTKPEAR